MAFLAGATSFRCSSQSGAVNMRSRRSEVNKLLAFTEQNRDTNQNWSAASAGLHFTYLLLIGKTTYMNMAVAGYPSQSRDGWDLCKTNTTDVYLNESEWKGTNEMRVMKPT
jgi:hypothetical protein